MPEVIRVGLLSTVVEFGGIERVLLTLLENKEPGIELFPIVYTRTDTGENLFFESLERLEQPYDRIYVNARKHRYLNPPADLRRTIELLREKRVDVIHTNGYRADLLGFIAAKYLRIPVVATCHGFIAVDRRVRFYNRLDALILKRFDRVVAVSDRLRTELIEAGVDARKIETIRNSIGDVSRQRSDQLRANTRLRIGIDDDDFVFGFVGRLSEEKGLTYLLESLRGELGRGRTFRLIVVGEGPQRRELEKAAVDLGLGGSVIFTGFQKETAEWYAAMDVFVLPSLTEGTPMVLLEAMAHALPVIATAVGGVPAVVRTGENGLLVPPGCSARLAEAMRALAGDPERRRRLAEEAARSVKATFDVGKWLAKMREMYAITVEESRRKNA